MDPNTKKEVNEKPNPRTGENMGPGRRTGECLNVNREIKRYKRELDQLESLLRDRRPKAADGTWANLELHQILVQLQLGILDQVHQIWSAAPLLEALEPLGLLPKVRSELTRIAGKLLKIHRELEALRKETEVSSRKQR